MAACPQGRTNEARKDAPNDVRKDAPSDAREDVPNDPTDLSGGTWRDAAKRTLKEYKDDDLQDRAAALTYFGIQSIFPGLLVLVSLLGLVGHSVTQSLINNVGKVVGLRPHHHQR